MAILNVTKGVKSGNRLVFNGLKAFNLCSFFQEMLPRYWLFQILLFSSFPGVWSSLLIGLGLGRGLL